MGSEWFVFGGGVTMFFLGLYALKKATNVATRSPDTVAEKVIEKVIVKTKNETRKKQSRSASLRALKDGEATSSKFSNLLWTWTIEGMSDQGVACPNDQQEVLPTILLQDIRDNQNRNANRSIDLEKDILTELKSLNAYMHQLFGPDNDPNR